MSSNKASKKATSFLVTLVGVAFCLAMAFTQSNRMLSIVVETQVQNQAKAHEGTTRDLEFLAFGAKKNHSVPAPVHREEEEEEAHKKELEDLKEKHRVDLQRQMQKHKKELQQQKQKVKKEMIPQMTLLPQEKERGKNNMQKKPKMAEDHTATATTKSNNSAIDNNTTTICQSPEYTSSHQFTCSLDNTELGDYVRKTLENIMEPYKEHCSNQVVYGVAFGSSHTRMVQNSKGPKAENVTKNLLEQHSHCFFMFVLADEADQNQTTITAPPKVVPKSADGLDWMVPIPPSLLPYQEMRRNAKLFKYMGHWMFANVQRVVWQDAKFRRPGRNWNGARPKNYYKTGSSQEEGACATFMGLPLHPYTVGKIASRYNYSRPQYVHHCEHVVASLKERPGVTDSPEALLHQCEHYQQQFQNNNNELNHGLADTGFIVWNNNNTGCSEYNAMLQCGIMNEIHCHSDRDQVALPFALATSGVQLLSNQTTTNPEQQPLLFGYPSGTEQGNLTTVHITEYKRHWYYGAHLEEFKESKKGRTKTDKNAAPAATGKKLPAK